MAYFRGPNLKKENLLLLYDPYNIKSYPGAGETLLDLAQNGNNATLFTVTQGAEGFLSFDGTGTRDRVIKGSYIGFTSDSLTTNPSVRPNGITYQIWMRFTGEQIQGHGILGTSTINHLEWKGALSNGYWRTEARLENGYRFGSGAPPSYGGHTINEWFQLTLVFANDETGRPVRWYMNGELFDTRSMELGANPTTEHFNPGQFGISTGSTSFLYSQSFKGDLGQFIVYDVSLTPLEILSNFNATHKRFNL